MNPLHEAYSILGLKPGSSKETILSRWKRLAMVWHPDRLPTEDGKREAEEELKKINNAKDVLWKHFESGAHKSTGCECQPGSASQGADQNTNQQRTGHGPGPKRSRNPDPEEEARQRDAERRRRAAEEAAQQQQAQEQARQEKSYQAALQQEIAQNKEKLRWKIAKAEAVVFAFLCVFGSIGSGINQAWHDWQSEQERKKIQAAEEKAAREDPCQSGAYPEPPAFVQPNVLPAAQSAVKLWRVNCRGHGVGAIVTGEDSRGQLITGMYYGTNLSYQGQVLVHYESSPDKTTVEKWNPPNTLEGQTCYSYDSSHNLTEIRQLDAQSQPVIVCTIERRPGGGFFAVDAQFVSGNTTTKFYSPDDPQLTKNFYLFGLFGKIAKQIDTAPTITSPDVKPFVPSGDSTPGFRATPFAQPFSTPGALTPNSGSTATGTDEHIMPSPFEHNSDGTLPNTNTDKPISQSPFLQSQPSLTPTTDALIRTFEKQNNK